MLAAAHGLLAEGGPQALTMRALAQRLDVTPNALYSHVPNKTALIDDLIDDVLAGVEAPSLDTGYPRAALHRLMASTYDTLLARPDLVPLYLARRGARGPNAQRLGGIVLGLLDRVGVDTASAPEALRVLIVYTIGFAAFASSPPIYPASDPPAPGEELQANFDRGLSWLLTGIAPV
jgi:TetR/AcrR family tetracycline transcriptional repressor